MTTTTEQTHPFNIGEPLWVHGDNFNTWLPIAFVRPMWSEWIAICLGENDLTGPEHRIPANWLCNRMPGEPVYADNVVRLADYRR